jgi:hypothetical protein
MKQFFIIILSLVFISCASSSVKKEEIKSEPIDGVDVFSGETPGQYVIYHDKRAKRNALCSFLKFNKTDYVARRFDLNSGDEIVMQFKAIKKADGEFDIKVVNVFAGDQAGVMWLLTDMLNMITQYGFYTKQGKDNTIIRDEWKEYGYTLNHSYKAWMPFFHLYKTEMQKEPENSFTLILTGIMKDSKQYQYFNLKSIPQSVKFEEFKLQKAGSESVFKFGMFETRIDQNWSKSGVDNEYIQSYWVRKKSLRDATVTMEVIPQSMFNGELDKLAYKALGFSTWVIPSSVKIEKKKNFVKLEYLVLDPSSMNETYMYDIHMKDRNGDLNSFHFSSYKEVYYSNKKYFDSIIYTFCK